MQVCTLFQADNHASTPPLSFLQAGCPSCRLTNNVKALKAPIQQYKKYYESLSRWKVSLMVTGVLPKNQKATVGIKKLFHELYTYLQL